MKRKQNHPTWTILSPSWHMSCYETQAKRKYYTPSWYMSPYETHAWSLYIKYLLPSCNTMSPYETHAGLPEIFCSPSCNIMSSYETHAKLLYLKHFVPLLQNVQYIKSLLMKHSKFTLPEIFCRTPSHNLRSTYETHARSSSQYLNYFVPLSAI